MRDGGAGYGREACQAQPVYQGQDGETDGWRHPAYGGAAGEPPR